jgi:hypothetical protein
LYHSKFISDMLAIGIGPGPDRIVDHRQIGAKAGNADANTRGKVLAPSRKRPTASCLAVACQGKPQH